MRTALIVGHLIKYSGLVLHTLHVKIEGFSEGDAAL